MAPVVRIDDEVWQWLKGLARPFEDTPNSVLRRVAGLQGNSPRPVRTDPIRRRRHSPSGSNGVGPTLLRRFRASVEAVGTPDGVEVHTWEGGHRRSANVLELRRESEAELVYVKTRSDAEGFWGLRSTFLDTFEASQLPWFVVLLIGPGEKGYLLSSDQVLSALAAERWSLGQAGDYKVHEGPEVEGAGNYNSHAALAGALLQF